jgi:hypothetical protein
MNKKFSQIALLLIVLANINPVMAASKTPNADLSTQKLDAVENPNNMILAQFLQDIQRTVNEVTNTVDTITNPRNNRRQIGNVQRQRQQQRAQERQARQEERKRQQAERAEQRRQFLESLSPEERSAFLQKERELQGQMIRTLVEGAIIMEPMMRSEPKPRTSLNECYRIDGKTKCW